MRISPRDSPSFHGNPPWPCVLGLATTEEGKASSAWVWHGLVLLTRPNAWEEGRRKKHPMEIPRFSGGALVGTFAVCDNRT